MKREWFFLKDESPLGPYNLAEIENFIHQNEIKADTLIQNIADTNWKPAFQYSEFSTHFPDAAVSLNLKTKNLSLPSIDSLNVSEDELREEKVEFTLKEYKLPSKFKKENKSRSKMLFFTAIVLVFLFSFYFLFFKSQNIVEVDIEDIDQSNHVHISELVKKDSDKVELDIFLTKDKKNLFLVSNNSSKMFFELILTPSKDNIVGLNPITHSFSGVIENKFGKIKLSDTFLIGKYSFKFTIKKIPNWVTSTRLESIDFFKQFDQDLTIESSKIIFDQTEEKFQEAYKKFLKEELNKLQKPFLEKIARIETLIVTLNQIWMALEDNLKYLKTGNDVLVFENIYKREAEIILQRLLFDEPIGDRITNELISTIMQFTQKTVDDVKILKKINSKTKEKLTSTSYSTIKDFENRAKNRIEEIKILVPQKL